MTGHQGVVTVPGKGLAAKLEEIYQRLNRREYVHPDPLEFLYPYDKPSEMEVVGLVAATLAYGRVTQILSSVERVLSAMESPLDFVIDASEAEMKKAFSGFRHRFTTQGDLTALLRGIRGVIRARGSLGAAFTAQMELCGGDAVEALRGFVQEIRGCGGSGMSPFLLPDPAKKSACKRLFMYLRWMVRKDQVDPGPWEGVNPSALIVPLDTHMFKIARGLGFTNRKSPDLATACEVTQAFAALCPIDPVRYDFVLTRFGIRNEMDVDQLLGCLAQGGRPCTAG